MERSPPAGGARSRARRRGVPPRDRPPHRSRHLRRRRDRREPRRRAATGEATSEPAADAVELAVGAFLLRPEGWAAYLERAQQDVDLLAEERRRELNAERVVGERDRVIAELAATKEAAAADRAALEEARAEIVSLRRQERRLRSDADRARAEARAALAEASSRMEAAEALAAQAAGERREASVALDRAHAAREEARTLVHTGAELANARARLLLETVVDAAVGLRRELGIPPTTLRPGDTVAVSGPGRRGGGRQDPARLTGSLGRRPALLDDVLAVPQMHLIVDGYNVTKTGFGTLTLAQQRRRLVDGLVRVASRTGPRSRAASTARTWGTCLPRAPVASESCSRRRDRGPPDPPARRRGTGGAPGDGRHERPRGRGRRAGHGSRGDRLARARGAARPALRTGRARNRRCVTRTTDGRPRGAAVSSCRSSQCVGALA
ncbi:hypothetical protein NKG05_26530 [Oerskovia sp. M15]